ncbi:hypothetical protein CHS0354_009524 [Potamilus streckersoni]|uniref:RING-type domain-containing protein n=1 Tax=Potamilus streckersoni TaxID=2493646 RepID=A0AAE0SQ51_9BIVA|nr:hypothetical protein CHS0354_009524 [Potamilus streckersoni]
MAEESGGEHRQLMCPICLEPFESPKVLTCLHTFCEKCICNHAYGLSEQGTHSDTIACPVCRIPAAAPTVNQILDDWATKLPNNSTALSSLASDQSVKDDSVYCQPCVSDGQQQLSIAYCVTCMEYLCQACYKCP